MSKKTPWLLALLVGGGSLLARSAAAQPIGAIDTPTPGQRVSGVVRVSGFFLDFNAVDRIEVLVNGIVVNRADINIPRADILEAFPNYVGSPTNRPGFLSSFLARNYPNGPQAVSVRVSLSNGSTFTLGPVSVMVDNTVNQAPFGWIDTPGPQGVEGANGSFPVSGWALDDMDVDHIDFLVDGQVVAGAVGRGRPGSAVFGSPRPDVYAAFVDFPGPNPTSLYSGFIANIDTTRFVNGIHIFAVRVTDNRGLSAVIGTRRVQIINNGSNLAPFGRVDFPLDKASLLCSGAFTEPPPPSGVCPSPCQPGPPAPGVPNLILNRVTGWALDVGSALDRGQVSYVELLFDGAIVANTRRDCVHVPPIGGIGSSTPVNCYGVNRPDVARFYQGYVNADNAGWSFYFAFVRDPGTGLFAIVIPGPLGSQIVTFAAAGKHTIAIRVGDEEATVTQIGAMSVDLICDISGTGDRPAFGFIDSPGPYEFVRGVDYPVFGWAFDYDGIRVTGGVEDGIEIDVDGQVLFRTNNDRPRPDVPLAELRVNTQFVGFAYTLDTTRLNDGEHDLVVYVVDAFLRRSEIGRKKFVVNNNTLTLQ